MIDIDVPYRGKFSHGVNFRSYREHMKFNSPFVSYCRPLTHRALSRKKELCLEPYVAFL